MEIQYLPSRTPYDPHQPEPPETLGTRTITTGSSHTGTASMTAQFKADAAAFKLAYAILDGTLIPEDVEVRVPCAAPGRSG